MNKILLRLITAYLAFALLIVSITFNTVSIPFALSNKLPGYMVMLHITALFISLYLLACKIPDLFEPKPDSETP